MNARSQWPRVLGLILSLAGIRAGAASAQAAPDVAQADVQLQSLQVTRRVSPVAAAGLRTPRMPTRSTALDITATVYSTNDDDAWTTQIRIFLPPETRPLSMPAGCQPSEPLSATTAHLAFVTCDLGTLTVGASRSIQMAITAPPAHVVPRVSAFAWSLSSDPNVANNYAERVVP